MAKEKPVTLGHIDCPTCEMKDGMAVKMDKGGHAFGFCEDCAQQLFTRNPFKSKRLLQRMRPVTAPTAPAPVTEPKPVPAPAAPQAAGDVKSPVPAESIKPEPKTPPAPAPAAAPASKPAPAPWFAPIIGKSARQAA
ncbi:hypothetical protein [Massilia sp. GCM10023247]|uniref:hypothetical protein n=1 Tax=Massilia sp. GCM10023247 TaxID=3252643 RepID=UPI00360B9D52